MTQNFTLPTPKNDAALIAPPPGRGRLGGGQELQFRELPSLLVGNSRKLRREMTDAERKLWHRLRMKQISGLKFRRQHPIGPYIADFACIECKLVIELDGSQHAQREEYDKRRDSHIQQQGYHVLRFWNNDVMSNIEGVLAVIVQAVADPHPASPFQGEEKKENV